MCNHCEGEAEQIWCVGVIFCAVGTSNMKISIVSVYLCFGYCSCQRICYCSTRNSSSFFFSNGHPPVVGDRARAWRYKRTNRQFLWWWCTEASSAAKTCSAFPSMLEKFQEFFFYLSVQKLRSIYTQKRRSKKRISPMALTRWWRLAERIRTPLPPSGSLGPFFSFFLLFIGEKEMERTSLHHLAPRIISRDPCVFA